MTNAMMTRAICALVLATGGTTEAMAQRAAASGWVTDEPSQRTASGVRANEDSRVFLQYQCYGKGATRAQGLMVGEGESIAYNTNGTRPGFTAFFGRIPSLTVEIVGPTGTVQTLTLKRNIKPDMDWGFSAHVTPAMLTAIKKAGSFRMALKGQVLTFTGRNAAQAIAATQCQEEAD